MSTTERIRAALEGILRDATRQDRPSGWSVDELNGWAVELANGFIERDRVTDPTLAEASDDALIDELRDRLADAE